MFWQTRTQRLVSFGVCSIMGLLCFCLSAVYIPVLLLKARKFALLYSLGSLFFLMRYVCVYVSLRNIYMKISAIFLTIFFLYYSFCFLWGPISYIKSLFTAEKRCFTVSYFTTLAGTLYFALHLQSTPLTIFCAILQLIAMLSFLVSHIPGGTTGLMFFTRIFKSSVKSTLPVW